MTRQQLEDILRKFEPLKFLNVQYESDFRGAMAPHLAKVVGCVNLYGQPFFYEVDVNLNDFKTQSDVVRLAQMLINSIDAMDHKAEKEKA